MVITMPQLGETVTEGTIVRWNKAVGDEVAEDEVLFEVSTDKVDSDVPSSAAGILTEILVPAGMTAAIGAALAVVTPAGEPAEEARAEPFSLAEPVARVPADPTPVVEAGFGARVTRADVERRLDARARPLTEFAGKSVPPTPAATKPATPPTLQPGDEVVPFTNIRRRIAEHMVQSITSAAHTLVVMEADYTAVDRARARVRASFQSEEGFGLSYLPFVARAVADAIREFPKVNASIGDDALIVHAGVHLGIAVDLEYEGLVVPVVRDADAMRLRALARALNQRAIAARDWQLIPDDLHGGTFTLTNAGGYGTLLTAPIINQPQVAIISTDGVSMRPVAVPADQGEPVRYGIALRPIGNLALSFDHRAFDGAYASAFLRRVVVILATRDWSEELL